MKRQIMSNSAFMNSTDVIMDKKKEKLRNKLKQDVSREEQSIASSKTAENRRISCISILDAVDEFLGVWEEELEEFSGLPRDFLRQTLSKVVRELGPGNADLRESVFSTLQSTTSKECRQIILDFLPLAMPLRNDRENKVEVLQILKIGFEEDPSIVAPVLECLSAMRNSGRLMGKDIFQFIVQVILKVPDESPFHNMIRCLIENITSQNDAIIAVEVVRTELRSVEELGSIVNERCIASIAEELLILKNEGNSCLFFEVYLSVLEDILRENADTKGTSLGGEPLIAVDIVIILLYLECGERSGQVERMFDAALTQSSLSLDMLCFLLRALVQEKRTSEITSGPLFEDSTRSDLFISLLDSLVSLALFLLLSPIRIREFEKVSTLTKGFVLDLLLKLDQERQRRLISSMMHLDEELFRNINETSVESTIKPVFESKGRFTDPSENNIRKVCIVVFEILNGVAKKSIQTMIPFKQVLVNKLRSGDFIEEYHDDTLQQLCSLISYLEASRHKATMETDQVVPDVFLTIRRLLFSQPRIVSPSDELRNDASCIRGLVLATTVVSGNHLSHAKTLTVWQSVRMVLLPSTNRSINPRVGLYALKFVRVLARWNKKDNVETFSFIEQQIFQTMTRVLSNSRIIQYVTSFDERQKEDSTLYYTERPPFFGIGARKRKVRKMIVSFKTFFPDKFTVSPSGWKDSSQWVFDLVDTYLSIGRTVSLSSENKGGWSPHPWVEAALEVPRLDISRLKAIGTRQRRSLQLMQKELSSRDISNCNDTLSDGLDKDVSDMIRNTKDSNDFEEMLHSMFRFTLSLILGLTMTAAVLNNTYRRYRDILRDIEDNSSCGKKMEALKQLQHQLVKIYDLRRMCQSMQRMFLSMTTTTRYLSSKAGKKRKRGKSQRGPSVGNKIASEQLKAVLSHLFGTEDFIRSEILWACLVDPTQDRVVTNAVENDRGESLLSMGTDELKNMAIIVDVKLNVLEHLIAQIRHFSLLGGDREPKISLLASKRTMLIVRSRLAQCFRLCSYLSLHLPRLLQDFSNWRLDKSCGMDIIDNLSSLTAAYFRLLFVSLVFILEPRPNLDDEQQQQQQQQQDAWEGVEPMKIQDFYVLYRSILGSEDPLKDAIHLEENPPQKRYCFESVTKSFLSHLRVCDDAGIASQLLEALSVFAINHSERLALPQMIDLSWKALHSKYRHGSLRKQLHAPYSFIIAVRRLMPSSLCSLSNKNASERAFDDTIMKLAFSKSKNCEKHVFLIHGMLRHWGLLALSDSMEDHLYQLFSNLQGFLSETNEPLMAKLLVPREHDTSDDDGAYFPPHSIRETKPVLPTSDVPGLSASSFSIYFDVLLQMTIGAVAIFPVGIAPKSAIKENNDPFHRLENLFEVFGALIGLFKNRSQFFPRRVLSTVFNTSKAMLSTTAHQLDLCVEWRSSQPFLSANEIEAGAVDLASTRFLEGLLNSCAIHVVGKLQCLCDHLDLMAKVSSMRTKTYDDDNDNFGVGQTQHVKSLRIKADKVLSDIRKVALAHNIPESKINANGTNDSKSMSAASRRKLGTESLFHLDKSMQGDVENSHIDSRNLKDNNSSIESMNFAQDKGKNRSPNIGLGPTASRKPTSIESSSISDSSESFGASGDWGQDSDSDTQQEITRVA